jgi:hypothetical protein
MKTQKPLIKIIKRDERESAARAIATPADKEDGAGDLPRQADSTVEGWVREFQRKRHDEHERALVDLREARALLPEHEPDLTPAGA